MKIGTNKYLRLYYENKVPVLGTDGVIFGLDGRKDRSSLNDTVLKRVQSLQGVKPGFRPAYYSIEDRTSRTEKEITTPVNY